MRRLASALAPTFRYWMRTDVHVFAFSVAANVLLSFFPFLIVMSSLAQRLFNYKTALAAVDTAMNDFFPDTFSNFITRNLPYSPHLEIVSLVLLLFTANGIFEPLEVALNHVWGVSRNRNFFHNQLVSLALIFVCGGLAISSLALTGMNHRNAEAMLGLGNWIPGLFFKIAAVPITVVILFLIYYFVPNFRPPRNRVIAAAIVTGILMEALKFLSKLVWPWMFRKLSNEYGVFKYSVALIFLGFCSSMLVLAGAEWAARGNRADREIQSV
jgi:membrane protein